MIKELTPGEATVLRERIKKRYAESPFNGAGFRITQYKEAYQGLADDIARAVPGAAASVTTHRLRKLFYYSDPVVCAADKLEKPSFGDDFVRALREYAADDKPAPPVPLDQTKPPGRKWQVYAWPVLFLLLAALAGLLFWPGSEEYWTEDFNSVSIDSLSSRDWEILDYDAAAFSRQLKPGYWTAFTYPGGYWVKKDSGEVPMIKNMLVRRLKSDECVILARLKDFDPYQNWQGAGICLYGPKRSLDDNLTVFFVFARHPISPDSVEHVQKVQAVLLVNGKPREHNWMVRVRNNIAQPPVEEIEFELVVSQKQVSIFFRTDASWRSSFLDPVKLELPFAPAYVGLGASQGFTDFYGKALGADTIPAFFDYVRVLPLK